MFQNVTELIYLDKNLITDFITKTRCVALLIFCVTDSYRRITMASNQCLD